MSLPGLSAPLYRNTLLSSIPGEELGRLRPHLTRVRLLNGAVIHEAGAIVDTLLFVEQGFISLVADGDDSAGQVEVGLIGYESVVGLAALLLTDQRSYNQAIVQMPGVGYTLPRVTCLAMLDRLPVLHGLLLGELSSLLVQVTQTAACNGRHLLTPRLARWLLQAHDRVEGDELPLTQEFLSMMLAVRRSGVTVGVQALEATGLVQHKRGRIKVLNRAGLELAACSCYGRVRRFLAEVVQPPVKPHAKPGSVHI